MPDPRPTLSLAHSPDPDDAFMWWPITGKVYPLPLGGRAGEGLADQVDVYEPPVIDTGRFRFRALPADIEVLNRRAAERGDLDITALSFRAYCDVKARYAITRTGSSFGDGFGPKVICRRDQTGDAVGVHCENCLRNRDARIAVPGRRTTAFLLLGMLLGPRAAEFETKFIEMPFDQMEPAVVNRTLDGFVAVEPNVTVPSKVNKKTKVLGYPLGGIAPRLLIASYFASDAWIQKNVGTVKAFATALNRGIDAHNANPEEAKAVLARYTGRKPEVLKEMVLPAFEKKILESDLQPMMDVSLRYKLIEKKFPPREVISQYALA